MLYALGPGSVQTLTPYFSVFVPGPRLRWSSARFYALPLFSSSGLFISVRYNSRSNLIQLGSHTASRTILGGLRAAFKSDPVQMPHEGLTTETDQRVQTWAQTTQPAAAPNRDLVMQTRGTEVLTASLRPAELLDCDLGPPLAGARHVLDALIDDRPDGL